MSAKPTTPRVPSPAEQMLRWVALYVTAIDASVAPRGRGRVEITAASADRSEMIVVRRTGRDAYAAFCAAVLHGLRQIPLPPADHA
jgi:hypothetical protein